MENVPMEAPTKLFQSTFINDWRDHSTCKEDKIPHLYQVHDMGQVTTMRTEISYDSKGVNSH